MSGPGPGLAAGLGGHWCLIPRHSISFSFHKTNLICENSSCSWRFQRYRSCNYCNSRGGAIRCDADGSRREGIFIGLGGHWCLIPRHSISFSFYKTNLICENTCFSFRFQPCQFCWHPISRGGAIRCDADGSRREGIFIGLGGHWCLIPRHSINFSFHKTNLICENTCFSFRFQRCQFCRNPISRGGAIRCDADDSRREGIHLFFGCCCPLTRPVATPRTVRRCVRLVGKMRDRLISYNLVPKLLKGDDY